MNPGANPISSLPQEEPVFILKASQIQDIIAKALSEAQGSTIAVPDELHIMKVEIEGLKSQIKEHESRLDWQSKKIEDLTFGKDLQPEQKNRREILLALLAANGGKMFAKDARQKMGLGKSTFSVLLKSLSGEIDKKPYHLNKSKLVMVLK